MIRFYSISFVAFLFVGAAFADDPGVLVPVNPVVTKTAVEKSQFVLTCDQDFTNENGQLTQSDEPGITLRVTADGKGKYECHLGRDTWVGFQELSPKVECGIQLAFREAVLQQTQDPKQPNGDFVLKVTNLKQGIDLSLNVGTRISPESTYGARYKGKMSIHTETYKVTCDAHVLN